MGYNLNGPLFFVDTDYLNQDFINTVKEFFDACEVADANNFIITKKRNYGKVRYLNAPASFDIETSSLYVDDEKFATMYVWQFGINGAIIMGRTWTQFLYFCRALKSHYTLSKFKRVIVYVHNLGYEFQFIRKWFNWVEVFAPKKRRTLFALSDLGIEFRCSYLLSNYSLANVGKLCLHKYKVEKAVGDLDYSLVRTSVTPLTDTEIGYCVNDIKVVCSYIQERIELDGDITKIPLTNTGVVRNYVRNRVFTGTADDEKKVVRRRYNDLMKTCRIQSYEEYNQWKRAFAGGFTHAAPLYSRKIVKASDNGLIGSMDLASSYPYVCVSSYFPMSGMVQYRAIVRDISEFKEFLLKYCCLFDIEVSGLTPKFEWDNMLSASKCNFIGNWAENNGRVIYADKLQTTMTELDFDTFVKFYNYKSIKILNLRCYRRGYLPRDLILAILDLYEAKTRLKGIEGREIEYMVSKNMINSCYGMMVTNIVRDEILYDDEWIEKKITSESAVSQLTDYNEDFNRFLYYGWGVYVTAHARHNLFSAILEFGEDYIYSDTDSLKGLNFDKHMNWIRRYNDDVFMSLYKMCKFYKIPFSKCEPKTNKGKKKLIGVWEIEGYYSIFKTIGAKRYIYEDNDTKELHLTCAGVDKKAALKYLLQEADDNHINAMFRFDYGLYLPPGKGGKITSTYVDTPKNFTVTDYMGNDYFCSEKSFIHLEPSGYYLTLTGEYLDFLKGYHDEYY